MLRAFRVEPLGTRTSLGSGMAMGVGAARVVVRRVRRRRRGVRRVVVRMVFWF